MTFGEYLKSTKAKEFSVSFDRQQWWTGTLSGWDNQIKFTKEGAKTFSGMLAAEVSVETNRHGGEEVCLKTRSREEVIQFFQFLTSEEAAAAGILDYSKCKTFTPKPNGALGIVDKNYTAPFSKICLG